MHLSLPSVVGRRQGERETRILMLGGAGAGKTTVMRKLRLRDDNAAAQPIGPGVETVHYEGTRMVCFAAWDTRGVNKTRPLWRHTYSNSTAAVLVVDSSDRPSTAKAGEELVKVFNALELQQRVPLLVLANKQDLPNAMSADEVSAVLDIKHSKCDAHVQGCVATTGEGLDDGIEWLTGILSRRMSRVRTSLLPARPRSLWWSRNAQCGSSKGWPQASTSREGRCRLLRRSSRTRLCRLANSTEGPIDVPLLQPELERAVSL